MAKISFTIDEKELDQQVRGLITGRIKHVLRNDEELKSLIEEIATVEVKKQVNQVMLLNIDVKQMAETKANKKVDALVNAAVRKLSEDISFITGAAISEANVKRIQKMFNPKGKKK